YDIDAALWIGDVGISGINAVAEILTGKVNPSGSLVDTYCYDNFSAPAMWNFTPTTYEGYVEGGDVSAKAKSYMIYQEGIYVGYKTTRPVTRTSSPATATQATTPTATPWLTPSATA
ncbi:MAG: glycoside hydrolase family 3 C-terminal domain-containing protein, partial [Gemmiger sp.]|nr:glycoside hydrolase family 3 C-terminal domain-containing protein [Gemmiger sp.]